MKKILCLISILIPYLAFTQDSIKSNGLFYKASLGITFTVNENYTITEEDDESFLNPSAFLVNINLGLVAAFSIFAHCLPQQMTNFSILLNGKITRAFDPYVSTKFVLSKP